MFPYQKEINTTQGTILIRPANSADAAAFSVLRLEALKNHPEAFESSFEELENVALEWSQKVLAVDQALNCNFVAEVKRELVGMATITHPTKYKSRHDASLVGVYIRPDWRRLGILDGFIEACLEWARAQQVRIIKLGVTVTNLSAVKSYTRLGFKIYATDPQVLHIGDQFLDEYLMMREV